MPACLPEPTLLLSPVEASWTSAAWSCESCGFASSARRTPASGLCRQIQDLAFAAVTPPASLVKPGFWVKLHVRPRRVCKGSARRARLRAPPVGSAAFSLAPHALWRRWRTLIMRHMAVLTRGPCELSTEAWGFWPNRITNLDSLSYLVPSSSCFTLCKVFQCHSNLNLRRPVDLVVSICDLCFWFLSLGVLLG